MGSALWGNFWAASSISSSKTGQVKFIFYSETGQVKFAYFKT